MFSRGMLALAVGLSLTSQAFAQAPSAAYVTNYGSHTVSVIDVGLQTTTASIPVGLRPAGLTTGFDGRFVYVTNSGSNTVSVIATSTNTVTATIPVGPAPSAIAVLPDNSRAYVINSGNSSVSVIDLTANAVTATLSNPSALLVSPIGGPPFFGNAPAKLAVTQDGRYVYVPNTLPNNRPVSVSFAIIDTQTHTIFRSASMGAIDFPGMALTGEVILSPDSGTGYATAYLGYVEVFSTATNSETTAVSLSGGNPGISLAGLALNTSTSRLYVTATEHSSVYIVDPTLPSSAIRVFVPAAPHSIALTPDNNYAYVTLGNDSSISVIGTVTNTVIARIPVGSQPFGVVIGSMADRQPPLVSCEEGPSGWSRENVAIWCSASDAGTGLANPGDVSFTLTTNVPEGQETSAAVTNSREVCDVAANCTTVGPFSFKVDRKGPVITIAVPTDASYLLNQTVLANYTCTDAGSGLGNCTGPVANGTRVSTSSPGTHTLQIHAVDGAGNSATTSVTYTVGYGISMAYDPSRAVKSGSTIPVRIHLVDAAGVNVSSSSVQVTATIVTLVGGTTSQGAEDTGQANADLNFRYDPDLAGYIFNLSTKGLAIGAYRLSFVVAGDQSVHTVGFVIGK